MTAAISSAGHAALSAPHSNGDLVTIQHSKFFSLFPNGLAEYAQKVPAADLSDLIRGEASL